MALNTVSGSRDAAKGSASWQRRSDLKHRTTQHEKMGPDPVSKVLSGDSGQRSQKAPLVKELLRPRGVKEPAPQRA